MCVFAAYDIPNVVIDGYDVVVNKPKTAAYRAPGATHAAMLTRGEGERDWRRAAAELDRRVRALNPWPGTWFRWRDERIRVLEAEPVDGPGGEPGEVLEGELVVACGSGALRLTRLQRPGRGALGGADFLRGFPLPAGTRLPPTAGEGS